MEYVTDRPSKYSESTTLARQDPRFISQMERVFTQTGLLRGSIQSALIAPSPRLADELKHLRRCVTFTLPLMENALEKLSGLSLTAPKIHLVFVSAITELDSLRKEFEGMWHVVNAKDDDLKAALADLLHITDRVIEKSGEFVIPQRLSQSLDLLNAGARINFDTLTREWIVNSDGRERIWNQLSTFRFLVQNGLVEKHTRSIYKCSTRPKRRLLSYVGLACCVVLSFGSFWLPSLREYATAEPGKMVGAELLVRVCGWIIAGVIGRAFFQTLSDTAGGHFPPFSELRDRIHVKEMEIAISIVSAWAATVLLVRDQPQVSALAAFAVGYTLDHLTTMMISQVKNKVQTLQPPSMKL